VARRRGVEVEEIDLWLLGGVSRLHGEPSAPGDELRFALAGPAVTAVIVAVAGVLRAGLGGVLPDWARALLDYQLYVNALILGFNLLPAFPLDGGRVTRSLLWRRMGDRERATDVAAGVGRVFGIGMVVLGVVAFLGGAPSGLWLALVGWFLVAAGAAEAQHQRLGRALGGETAGELMSRPAVTLPGALPLDQAAAVFGEHLYSGFPVVAEDGRAIGVLTIDGVRAVPAHLRPDRVALDAAARSEELLVTPATPAIELLERPEFQEVGRAVVVDGDGRPLGVISMTDVQRRLRVAALRA
jgi:CBS domain-containing protein